ncbi:formate/nitrite transporter family protein [Clostridium tetani]|uniref:formate/nitrite transporter family protein n=1 Tax=Clostridium tetani TaxID=1513 RepID=UPI00100B4C9A|nr:formate/nitrite transporter family protein [Clostridium tetani]RXM56909.1 nitrite transporter NirC [Clostridium tetani]RXM76292.1 nitrite transporter NirC [Clostridium tetani]RYU98954.1 nitrite transporter NirC [Clostridium tetani]
MFSQEINKLAVASEKKVALLKESKAKYVLASMLAGIYVGFGILLIFSIGGILSPANSPFTKIIMGVSFGIALSLVLVAGSELFTGNNLIMTIGALEKKVTWKSALNVWIFSYIGNFIGSFLLGLMFTYSGLPKGNIAKFIISGTKNKIAAPSMELFIRGILCNMLVCLAVWCFFKLKEEGAKLIMIFWCLFAFITAGFEHSVANMTLFSIAYMIPHGLEITFGGLMHNMLWVTLGNFVGGALFIGWTYWYISKKQS